MIIRRNRAILWIVVLSVIFILGTLNLRFKEAQLKEGNQLKDGDQPVDTILDPQDLVVAPGDLTEDPGDFFVEYRLERDRVRAEGIDTLREIINNPNSKPEMRDRAQEQLIKIVETQEQEMIVENLLRAKGFQDALYFYREGVANIVVYTEGLTREEAVQIADVVSRTTGTLLENINIIEKK